MQKFSYAQCMNRFVFSAGINRVEADVCTDKASAPRGSVTIYRILAGNQCKGDAQILKPLGTQVFLSILHTVSYWHTYLFSLTRPSGPGQS